jgi:hypothetical protein
VAILAINQAIAQEAPTPEILTLLQAPHAGILKVDVGFGDMYRSDLIAARKAKVQKSGKSTTTGGVH